MIKAEDVMFEAIDLKKRKSKDYQGGKWTEADYFPYGQQSFNHMMWTKMLRIMSVSDAPDVNFESLEDSLIDMINYAAMNVAYLRNKR